MIAFCPLCGFGPLERVFARGDLALPTHWRCTRCREIFAEDEVTNFDESEESDDGHENGTDADQRGHER
jgi:hypothetical protein